MILSSNLPVFARPSNFSFVVYSMIAVKSFRRLDRERGKIENCHNAAAVMVMLGNIGVHGHRA